MIPKKIHYVWFGGKPLDSLTLRCVESWRRLFPDYQIIQWDESSVSLDSPYLRSALANKKWSNASNYMRLFALKEFGGLYFDTDFEVIKGFDFLSTCSMFLSFENDIGDVNNAIMGAIPNHAFVTKSLEYLETNFDGLEKSNLSGPGITTTLLRQLGLKNNCDGKIEDISIFPKEYFHPYPWDEKFTYSCITEKTYGIHHWSQSWIKDDMEAEINDLRRMCDSILSGRIKFKQLLKLNLNYIKRRTS